MKNSFLIVTATLLVSVFFSCTKERVTAGSVNEVYEFQSVDSTWKLLTLREKIGQTMLMLPDRKKELDLGDGSLDVYFKRYPVTLLSHRLRFSFSASILFASYLQTNYICFY